MGGARPLVAAGVQHVHRWRALSVRIADCLIDGSRASPPGYTELDQRHSKGVRPADSQPAARAIEADPKTDIFLPDFCAIRMVFAVVVIAELLAFILTLSSSSAGRRWTDLSMISLFVQWVALSAAAVLCVSRPWLARLGNRGAAMVAYLLLLAVIVVVSELAVWLMSTGLGRTLPGSAHAEFLGRNLVIGMIVSALVLRYFYVQYQWQRHVQLESAARFEALQARIRPHFLFNALNVIASLTRTQPAQAERAVEDLSELFRFTLSEPHQTIALDEELELVRNYLHLEQLRLGSRLRVDWQVQTPSGSVRIPALLIQPLVENAVYHGIEPLPEGGTIEITVHYENGGCEFTICNPWDDAAPASSSRQRHGLAMDNIRRRLDALYGASGRLDVQTTPQRFCVRVDIPCRTAAN